MSKPLMPGMLDQELFLMRMVDGFPAKILTTSWRHATARTFDNFWRQWTTNNERSCSTSSARLLRSIKEILYENMSHFLFGRINLVSSSQTDEWVHKVVKENAIAHDLNILVGQEIPQPLVFEVLDEQESKTELGTADFLLVGRSVFDTSDEIISPYEVNDTFEQYLERLRRNLSSLEDFFIDISNTLTISSINIYFTEGYDNKFILKKVEVSHFVEECIAVFRMKNGIVPSLNMQISF